SDVYFRHAATEGQTGGSSTDTTIDLTECDNAIIKRVKATHSLHVGVFAQGCSNIQVIGGDYSLNQQPVRFAGCKGGKMLRFLVDGSILLPEVFKTGPQLASINGHAYGQNEDIEVAGLRVLNL